jgi:hypothetical protein
MENKKFKIDEGQKYEGNNYDGEQKYGRPVLFD